MHEWREILDQFSMTHCRCEKMSYGMRCVNYRSLHIKGHQFNLRGAARVRNGAFKSAFPEAIDALCEELSGHLTALCTTKNELSWRRNMCDISRMCGIDKVVSNRTCLTCLSRTPTNRLPCNHVICDGCIHDLRTSIPLDDHAVVISRCPLGCRWNVESWTIRRKPAEAGVRILSLDG